MFRKVPEPPTSDYLTVTNDADNYNEIEPKNSPDCLEAGIKYSDTKSKFQYDYAEDIEFNSDGTTTEIPVQEDSSEI
jgi:hypothetical protein